MTCHKILSLLAVMAALSAAGLWFYASSIPIPTALRVVDITVDGSGLVAGIEEMSAAFRKQGFWNAVAAAMTGAAVLLELVSKAFPPN
jgi:Na+/H+ antiporter NhaD/arsenite permease-like protein